MYELVTPHGAGYVGQIKDPRLSVHELGSLGQRLDLPDGWRYRPSGSSTTWS